MYYRALVWAITIKIMWGAFPFTALFIGCVIGSQFFTESLSWIAILLLCFFGLLAALRLIIELGNYFSTLYIDDEVIRFTFFRYTQEIPWSNAFQVEIREPEKKGLFYWCLLIVKGEKQVIQYPLSDLAPADQEAIKQRVALLPGYRRVL